MAIGEQPIKIFYNNNSLYKMVSILSYPIYKHFTTQATSYTTKKES